MTINSDGSLSGRWTRRTYRGDKAIDRWWAKRLGTMRLQAGARARILVSKE